MTQHSIAALARPDAARPSIPRPPTRWRTRILLPALIGAALLALLAYAGRNALRPSIAVHVVPAVAKAGRGGAPSGTPTVTAPGWIEADPFPVSVPALADGVVAEVLVLEGQRVEAGQVVARLIDADARLALAGADAELAARTAEHAGALAELAAAQSTWDNPIARVRDQAVAEAALAQANAELIVLEAAIRAEESKAAEIRDDYERKSRLADTRAVAVGELAAVTLRLHSQEATAEAARARLAAAAASADAARAELAAAREAFRLRIEETRALAVARAEADLAAAAARRAEAARDEARLRLDRMEVRAPTAGVVQARLVETGTRLMLESSDPGAADVMRLYDPARLQVRVDVPLAEAAKIGLGDRAEVITEALPGRTLNGRVSRLVQQADIQKNTVQFKVAIDDPDPELRPEMLARARFYAPANPDAAPGTSALAVFAPASVLLNASRDAADAWVVDQSSQTARRRQLKLGAVDADGWVEVLDGLRPGDRIIADPPHHLDDGDRVRVVGEAPASGGGR